MKVVILAGGLGTRLSEETVTKPKPMVEIGGMPILWHIMKSYSYYGHNEFIICAGYKQHMIKEWFADYFLRVCDVTFDLTQGNKVIIHDQRMEPWKITVVDTGLHTMTGGRIRRIRKYVDGAPFLLTYGDGVCDVNIEKLIQYHEANGKIATLTTVLQQPSKGVLDVNKQGAVKAFREKKSNDGAIINAGYMVLEPAIFQYLSDDTTIFEEQPMEKLASEGELMSYRHTGFWQCMDSVRERLLLENMWSEGSAPWKIWRD
nr:glucose-1-phosphate cytidylyltransferase [uncultured Schaedlerella sp.]